MPVTFIALNHDAATPARTVAIADRDSSGEPTHYLIKVTPPPFMGGSGGEVMLTADQFKRFQGWIDGSDNQMIQQIFPDLSADDREMLMSGLTDADLRRIGEADGGITPIGCYLDRAKAERQAAALASLYQVGWETNYP